LQNRNIQRENLQEKMADFKKRKSQASEESDSKKVVLKEPVVGEIAAVPAVGVAPQAAAPAPFTATLTAEAKPPPVKVTLPVYDTAEGGTNRT
jgi:hypothetical protein